MNYAPIKDWQGNEIRAGMIICFVQTKLVHYGLGYMIPGQGYVETQKYSEEDCWILGEENMVECDSDGRLFLTIVRSGSGDLEGYAFRQKLYLDSTFNPIWSGMARKSTIAIKVISDQEPENILAHGK